MYWIRNLEFQKWHHFHNSYHFESQEVSYYFVWGRGVCNGQERGSYQTANSTWWCSEKRIDAGSFRTRPRNNFPEIRNLGCDHSLWAAWSPLRNLERSIWRFRRSLSLSDSPRRSSWYRHMNRIQLGIYISGSKKRSTSIKRELGCAFGRTAQPGNRWIRVPSWPSAAASANSTSDVIVNAHWIDKAPNDVMHVYKRYVLCVW